MKRSLRILLRFGFWLMYLFFVAAIMFAATQGDELTPEDIQYYVSFVFGVAIIPPVLSYYAHYYFLFPTYLQKRKIILSVVMSALISTIATFIGFFEIQLTSALALNCIQTDFPYAFGFTFTFSTILGCIALIWKGFLKWYEELKLKEELLEKTHRMELALVKSQLDPHFLFNTINNIDVLIEKKPEEASTYLKKLSDIMRFMLYQTKGEQIPLAEELKYIEKYIELQEIRTGNPNYVHYKVHGTLNGQKIAPMMFIPFIENAFKHTNNKKIDHAIRIDLEIKEDQLHFKCHNKFDPNKKSAESNGFNGLGNDLIARRLNILYPEKHQLKVDKQEDQYSVELTIEHGEV